MNKIIFPKWEKKQKKLGPYEPIYFSPQPNYYYLNHNFPVVYISKIASGTGSETILRSGLELEMTFQYEFQSFPTKGNPTNIHLEFRDLSFYRMESLKQIFVRNDSGYSNEKSEFMLRISRWDGDEEKYNYICNFTWMEKNERNFGTKSGIIHRDSTKILSIFEIFGCGIENMEKIKEFYESIEFEIHFY